MARNTTIEETETVETVSEAAEAARAAIGSRPRQSVVRYVEYFNTLKTAAPEKLEEYFTPETIEVLGEVADKVKNPVQEAIEKATKAQVELAVKALSNTDELNGYANYQFSQEAFDEKTKERKPRVVKSKADKIKDVAEGASDEDLAALAELLKARGLV